MVFLGLLLLFAGAGLIVYGLLNVGLILIALGFICFSLNAKDKKDKEERKQVTQREEWIIRQTSKHIENGNVPSDAKVMAEVDYLKTFGLSFCDKCGHELEPKTKICRNCGHEITV